MEKGWKEIFFTEKEYQAIIARDILEESGINAVIINRRDSMYRSFGDFVVYVPEDSEIVALELIKELKN